MVPAGFGLLALGQAVGELMGAHAVRSAGCGLLRCAPLNRKFMLAALLLLGRGQMQWDQGSGILGFEGLMYEVLYQVHNA